MIATVNPATGELVKKFAPLSDGEIEEKLALADRAFRQWRRRKPTERAEHLARMADVLESAQDRFARLITLEMGKPLAAARAEVLKCAAGCRYYAEWGPELLADEPVSVPNLRSYLRFDPIGTVLAVMPWNFPFWQVFRFLAPTVVAGNAGLLKHASNVPQCALAIEEITREAGLPEGVFQTLLIESAQVAGLLADPRVKAASVTGSEAAGSSVASEAGKQIKKTVLELGGSDPFIVLPSANLDEAVRTAVEARTVNSGQSCIAAKRFIVHEAVADDFQSRFVSAMEGLPVGDPLDEKTKVGPLATAAIVEDLDRQVRRSVEMGAKLLTGGHKLDRQGFYYAPTVLADIPVGAPAATEELFGPVASLFRAGSAEQAVERANNTQFGLGACVWTTDEAEARQLAEEIEAGMVFINGMVASDPRIPFGGVKQSGYGRELGAWGIREFVNVKTVVTR